MSKLVESLRAAIERCDPKSGMTISFHHHLRNGDYVLNMVMEEIARMGLSDITINASSILDVHDPLVDYMRRGIVTGLECAYMSGLVAHAVTEGLLTSPAVFFTHGGRVAALQNKLNHIDIAFIAASASDEAGNCTGRLGKSRFGSTSETHLQQRVFP